MALELYGAVAQLKRSRRDLLFWQKELYLARVAPRPSQRRIRDMEHQVLARLTQVFNMQQCVKRLHREQSNLALHWRAFI